MNLEAAVSKITHAERTGDWMALRDAIDVAGDVLRTTMVTDPAMDPLAAKLVAHSEHRKWEVRKAVAHAVQHFRHDAAEAILARLATDSNAYVRDTAQRSRGRRAEAAHSGLLGQQHADLVQKGLTDLEAVHGPRARAAAIRVGKQYTELLMREAYHEVVRVISAQDLALSNLEAALTRDGAVDRDAALAHTRRARERGKHLFAMFRSMREFATAPADAAVTDDVLGMVGEAVELVEDALRKDRPALAKRFVARVSIGKDIAVASHRHRLVQALRNIIQNAAESYDAMPDARAVVTIAATKASGVVTLTIADEGCGMSEEAQREAFLLFATSKTYGTGIGLALVQSVIEGEHQGRVTLASKEGEGTTVTVVLPIERTGKR